VATFDDGRDCFLPNDTQHPGAATDHMNLRRRSNYIFQASSGRHDQTPTERQEALKFIVHFVGDIHQPFHAIGDARAETTPHHRVWLDAMRDAAMQSSLRVDSGMIIHTGMDVNAMCNTCRHSSRRTI